MLVSQKPRGTIASLTSTQRELQSPNGSWWNIGRVGARVGHVDFMFVPISFALGSNFRWNMDFSALISENVVS